MAWCSLRRFREVVQQVYYGDSMGVGPELMPKAISGKDLAMLE
jgi:hypothetical protein